VSNLIQTLADSGVLRVFATIVREAGGLETLVSEPCTVFAPTDDAFADLPRRQLEHLLTSRRAKHELLLRHLSGGYWDTFTLLQAGKITFLSGDTRHVHLNDGLLVLTFGTDSSVAFHPDIFVGHSVLHLLDTVLWI
jgi:uncharacterized surface protein with fasciclin (FAS1) repeats